MRDKDDDFSDNTSLQWGKYDLAVYHERNGLCEGI